MSNPARQAHWQGVYTAKGEREVSWFEPSPALSLQLIAAANEGTRISVIDVGGGASRLPDALVAAGYKDVTVLDVSAAALAISRQRLGSLAERVAWIAADVTVWEPLRSYDVWHDRAVFHFLTAASDRAAYVARLRRALCAGGTAIIGTFAMDGPEQCSGLPVVRYDAAGLAKELGDDFALVEARLHDHQTPWGSMQRFQFSVFRRR
ncbi:MAG: class I SAM-dependent methyltransferase [Hyphomicrobiales bacterium]|nr:class I SAM-dependent methyltransferase [Hyphomicrobiales bacterium]